MPNPDERTADRSFWSALLLGLWIFATAAFFYGRFTWVVYQSHETHIDRLIAKLLG